MYTTSGCPLWLLQLHQSAVWDIGMNPCVKLISFLIVILTQALQLELM